MGCDKADGQSPRQRPGRTINDKPTASQRAWAQDNAGSGGLLTITESLSPHNGEIRYSTVIGKQSSQNAINYIKAAAAGDWLNMALLMPLHTFAVLLAWLLTASLVGHWGG